MSKNIGRPRHGKEIKVKISVSMEPSMIKKLDAYLGESRSRSKAITHILEKWLEVHAERIKTIERFKNIVMSDIKVSEGGEDD